MAESNFYGRGIRGEEMASPAKAVNARWDARK